MAQIEKSAHMAWCALVALALEKQDKNRFSSAQENLFLLRWLAKALKQHRFPREVAPDIGWLIKQGRIPVKQVSLAKKIEYLWCSCTQELLQQTDIFRLIYALDTAMNMQWQYRLLSDREWTGRNAVTLNDGVNSVCISRSGLDQAFDNDGQQIFPLMARLTGQVAGLQTLFKTCGWTAETEAGASFLYRLSAEKASLPADLLS